MNRSTAIDLFMTLAARRLPCPGPEEPCYSVTLEAELPKGLGVPAPHEHTWTVTARLTRSPRAVEIEGRLLAGLREIASAKAVDVRFPALRVARFT